MHSQRPALPAGTQVGKYVIESHLGEGGNGAVYAALDSVLGRRVALKLLHPNLVFDPQIAGRFRQEAQAMAQLNHPNVVIVHDLVGDAGTWAIVMELVEGGETLSSLLKREGRITPIRALRLIKQVAAGLGHAHGRGVVHRDVKPANVMIVRQHGGEIAKISDFGIARLVHGEKRTHGQLTLGTLWYLAPEQAQSSTVDARADVYALGATLYEALTGRVVFPYDNVARVLAAALSEVPTPPSVLVPGIPAAVDELVLRFIAKSPEARPAHGEEARILLEHLEHQLEAPSRSMTPSSPVSMHAPASHEQPSSPGVFAAGQGSGPQGSGQTPAPAGFPSPGPHGGFPPPRAPANAIHTPLEAMRAPSPTTPSHTDPSPTTPSPLVDPQRLAGPANENRVGFFIGVAALGLISFACLASAFLCIVSGFLRNAH